MALPSCPPACVLFGRDSIATEVGDGGESSDARRRGCLLLPMMLFVVYVSSSILISVYIDRSCNDPCYQNGRVVDILYYEL